MEQAALPPGWTVATIADLISADGVFCDGDWIESKDQDTDGDVRLVQLADVGDGHYRDRSRRFLTSGKARQLSCTYLQAGDVLIARMPDPLGRACVFPGDVRSSVTAVDICIIRPGQLGATTRWLMHAVNAPDFRRAVEGRQSGTTRKRISRRNLSAIHLPVPPASEQRRIADKADELLSRLDAAAESLSAAQRRLKSYRQAVLRDAFTGKLTAEWREQQLRDPGSPLWKEPASVLLERVRQEREKLESRRRRATPPALDTAGLPELPEGWEWCSLEEICLTITKGESPSWQGFAYVADGVTFIRSQNVLAGRLDLSEEARIPPSFHMKLARSQVRPGDVLYNIVGASIGRSALVPEHVQQANVNQAVSLLRPGLGVLPAYLMHLLNSPGYRERMLSKRVEVARPNVSLQDLRGLSVPLPPAVEQEQLAEEVARRFSLADAAEQTIERSLNQTERLRQSILKRAFEGKLVPQDPADEPAERLLERIRGERAELAAAGGGGRARRRSERTAAARQAPRGERETA